jgi:hypothetical protein
LPWMPGHPAASNAVIGIFHDYGSRIPSNSYICGRSNQVRFLLILVSCVWCILLRQPIELSFSIRTVKLDSPQFSLKRLPVQSAKWYDL